MKTNAGLGSGEEVGGELFNRHSLSLGENEKVLEMDSGDVCTTKVMHYILGTVQLKMVKMVSFMLCTFCHQKGKVNSEFRE